MMKEVRIHGRGGQGAMTAVRLLASATFGEGKTVQAMPSFGVERRGAPIQAFFRSSIGGTIAIRTHVLEPDYVVVSDSTLLKSENVLTGLKRKGMVIFNTSRNPSELKRYIGNTANSVAAVDAGSIARRLFKSNVVNTVMVGASASATKEVSLNSVQRAIKEKLPGHVVASNMKAAEQGYKKTRVHSF